MKYKRKKNENENKRERKGIKRGKLKRKGN
jgi:hypothetical protein